jgi:peroxiredoxin
VVVISLEGEEDAKLTQAELPHLVVVADAERNMAEALDVIHAQSNPEGGDTTAPTTLLVDGQGIVRWIFRPDRYLQRLSPAEVLAAVDEHLSAD